MYQLIFKESSNLYLQNQCTPLHAASEAGFTEIVKLLIAADANVNCICEVSHYT